MTLQEIITAISGAQGSRFQISPTLALQYVNTVQQVAYNRNISAFLYWKDYLTVNTKLTMSASGYTNCVASDVTKTVTDGTRTGTLVSYDNTLREWEISSASGTFSGAITISVGTGAATFSSQQTSKGPYSWNSVSPLFGSLTPFTQSSSIRKMLGLTKATDPQLFLPPNVPLYQDYGFSSAQFDDRALFEVVRKYDAQKLLYFISTPVTTTNTYRWVGYIRPPTIASVTDDANLMLGPEFHQTCYVEGAQALADRSTYGGKTPEQLLATILEPFWQQVQQDYTPNGATNNYTSQGQL